MAPLWGFILEPSWGQLGASTWGQLEASTWRRLGATLGPQLGAVLGPLWDLILAPSWAQLKAPCWLTWKLPLGIVFAPSWSLSWAHPGNSSWSLLWELAWGHLGASWPLGANEWPEPIPKRSQRRCEYFCLGPGAANEVCTGAHCQKAIIQSAPHCLSTTSLRRRARPGLHPQPHPWLHPGTPAYTLYLRECCSSRA